MARRKDIPPIGWLLLSASPPATTTHSAPPPAPAPRDLDKAEELTSASVERLAGLATASTQGIMEACAWPWPRETRRGAHNESTHGMTVAQARPSFADALRLGGRADPVPIKRPPGPAVAIYPAEDQKDKMATAEDTKKALH
uniref:Uncharacterized protein n=1 Tax=Heliothis virescens TaxID=7102 RepID=A0A2A4JA82_HELVI